MSNEYNFANKHILIAGASSGIGRTIAIKLSRAGAKVTIFARSKEKLQETIGLLEGDDHASFSFDISATGEIENFLKDIIKERGAIDGFVYCIGSGSNRPLKVSKPYYMEAIMRMNFFGFFECCRVITKKGYFNPGMHIIGLSSCASIMGGKGQSAYSASKAAMDASVRIMAQELAEKKISINTIRPGMIETETYKSVMNTVSSKEQEELFAQQFLGLGKPEDIANLIAFMLSDASGFITGANISADGGYTCH